MRSERIKRIVGYALSRPEAYLVVVLVFVAVIVAIVGRWPGWVIPGAIVGGAVLLVVLIADSIADPNAEREASIPEVDLDRLSDKALRAKVNKALDYVRAVYTLARQDAGRTLGAASDELPQMEQAATAIYQMCLRVQEFRADPILQRDRKELQDQGARRRLTREQEAQLEALLRLEELIGRAEQEIDSALAHLGRSYAEMRAIKVTPELRGTAADALEELGASTRRLADLADGYDEIYGGRALPGTS